MTMAIAWAGGIDTASRPIDTVGRPSPSAPFTKPASRKAAVTRRSNESNMVTTLNYRRFRHNLEVPEIAFDNSEGYGGAEEREIRCVSIWSI